MRNSLRKSTKHQQASISESSIIKLENKENIDNHCINDMILMLKEYQQLCIQKEDFVLAEQAKNKMEFLKKQTVIFDKELRHAKEKENIEQICRQGEQEVKRFHAHWNREIQDLISSLKQVEQRLCEQQKLELMEYELKMNKQKMVIVKYSSKVLQLRKHLTKVIKIRDYKQAEAIKNSLKTLQIDEQEKWEVKMEEKNKIRIEQMEKRQNLELEALRIKLQGLFNEKIKQRDSKFQILLKKNRKRKIESQKSVIKPKLGILIESKISGNR